MHTTSYYKENIYKQGKQWVEHFLYLGHTSRLEGFQKKFVTPYIHCMVYHVPEQIRQHGSILKFSGQGKYYTHNATSLPVNKILLQLKVLKRTTTMLNTTFIRATAMIPVERFSELRKDSSNWTLPAGDTRGPTPNTTPSTGARESLHREQQREPDQQPPTPKSFFLSTGFSQSHPNIQGMHYY